MNSNASSNPSQQQVTLHPNLQAALSSLDVSLENEIHQFQQHQKQRKALSQSKIASSSSSTSTSSPPEMSPDSSAITTSDWEETSQFDEPKGYLASSEELLQKLTQYTETKTSSPEEIPPPNPEEFSQKASTRSWYSYLFTPLGVAGILIFLLSGTLLTMMLINMGEDRFRTPSSPNSQTNPTPTPSSQVEPPSPPKETESSSSEPEIPNRPNLAKDEFIDLDLENLVEAEPADQAAEEIEVPSSITPSCGSNLYCVMVENPSQSEYETTRQLVADAYLRQIPDVGQVLQVGAFDSESRAQELLQKLEQRGVSATIYLP
jgi:hypothetical protein